MRLIEGLGIRVASGDPGRLRVLDVTEDSRTAMPGSLFVARRGLESDGRAFAAEAVDAGAVAVLTDDPGVVGNLDSCVLTVSELTGTVARLAERFYGDPSGSLFVVGVTGTNGKTTVAHLAHRLLNAAGVRTGLVGTVDVDDGRERAPASMTTPPALELSRTLGVMVESGCRAAIMEVSSHALDQRRVDAVAFDAGVFTNLSGDHLDYHGSMDAYASAKRRLFEMVDDRGGVSIVNGHDDRAGWIAGSKAEFCWMNENPSGDSAAEDAGFDEPGWSVSIGDRAGTAMRLTVDGPWPGGPLAAWVELIGDHNAMNTLEAVAAAWHAMVDLGVGPAQAREKLGRGLTLLTPPRGRLEIVSGDDDPVMVAVDFAHTDDALRHALLAAKGIVPDGRELWVVFGAGGERDTTKRPRMGAVASELADRLIVTSDNPRRETPSSIISDIVVGIPKDRHEAMDVQADRERAIEAAVHGAGPGDVIVIAGKGHESEQLLPGPSGEIVRRAFDDREHARRALKSRRPVHKAEPA